jgi:cardiolipin synthase
LLFRFYSRFWHSIPGKTNITRYLVAATTVWSGLSYVFSKDAVKILSKEEVQKRIARAAGKKTP